MALSWMAVLVVVSTVVGSSACGGQQDTTPTGPTLPAIVESFTGTLTAGSIGVFDSHKFTAQAAGNIDAIITSINPQSTITVGLGLGPWDATTSTCSVQLANNVQVNVALQATVSSGGDYCVAVADVGNVAGMVEYVVQVTHF